MNTNLKLTIVGLLFSSQLVAQQIPTNNSPALAPLNGTNDRAFWSRAGNTPINGLNNIFGTLWNSPIYTYTAGLGRMRLNGTLTNTIDGYNTLKDGYLWLGYTGGFANTMFTGTGAFSLLHLNGRDGSFVQTNGHRNWISQKG